MTPAAVTLPLVRTDPTVRRIALSWRRLTGGTSRGRDADRRTLIACSGGADSSALVLALAAAVGGERNTLVVGHIVHDMRPISEASSDRDAVRALAEGLGLHFAEDVVSVRAARGNAEAAARRLRYAGLARLAAEHTCRFIATAHHADDQLETMLLALIRGSGPRGMSGIAERRPLGKGLSLIRPCLMLDRLDLERLCSRAGWEWRVDATNADVSLARAAIRHRIVPLMTAFRPRAAQAAVRGARLMAASARVLESTAQELSRCASTGPRSWDRGRLRPAPGIVLGEMLRRAVAEMSQGSGLDGVGQRGVASIVRHIRSSSGEQKQFVVGSARVVVDRKVVLIKRSNS